MLHAMVQYWCYSDNTIWNNGRVGQLIHHLYVLERPVYGNDRLLNGKKTKIFAILLPKVH